jgi:ribosomal protein L6P/L9E
MSRIGKRPIAIPSGVQITVSDTNLVTIKGKKEPNFWFSVLQISSVIVLCTDCTAHFCPIWFQV